MSPLQHLTAAADLSTVLQKRQIHRIVLLGFMGAGKSTIGRLLAGTLGWRFLDLDAEIEARAGASIPVLFATHGEPNFRRLESRALAAALAERQVVLALGGGTPEVLTNRLLLEQTPGTLPVFLQADFGTLYDRCLLQGLDRPVFADLPLAQARFTSRQLVYRRLARLTLPTAGRSTEDTAAELSAALQNLANTASKSPAIRSKLASHQMTERS